MGVEHVERAARDGVEPVVERDREPAVAAARQHLLKRGEREVAAELREARVEVLGGQRPAHGGQVGRRRADLVAVHDRGPAGDLAQGSPHERRRERENADVPPQKVRHVTTVHTISDPRIFHKECRGLAALGYDVGLIACHDRSEVVDGIRIVALDRPQGRLDPHAEDRVAGLPRRGGRARRPLPLPRSRAALGRGAAQAPGPPRGLRRPRGRAQADHEQALDPGAGPAARVADLRRRRGAGRPDRGRDRRGDPVDRREVPRAGDGRRAELPGDVLHPGPRPAGGPPRRVRLHGRPHGDPGRAGDGAGLRAPAGRHDRHDRRAVHAGRARGRGRDDARLGARAVPRPGAPG